MFFTRPKRHHQRRRGNTVSAIQRERRLRICRRRSTSRTQPTGKDEFLYVCLKHKEKSIQHAEGRGQRVQPGRTTDCVRNAQRRKPGFRVPGLTAPAKSAFATFSAGVDFKIVSGRPAVALGTVLEADHRQITDNETPEVVYRGDSVDTVTTVRTVSAADFVVDELTGVSRAGSRAVDEEGKVYGIAGGDCVVQVAVVEAVFVPRTRLTVVRQLVELVRSTQALSRDAVRRRVGGTKIVADRALDPDVGDPQRPVKHPRETETLNSWLQEIGEDFSLWVRSILYVERLWAISRRNSDPEFVDSRG